jgi:hypothetical protein
MQKGLRTDAATRGMQAGGTTMDDISLNDAPLGDAYWTEAIEAVDLGLFTIDSSPDTAQVRFELEKALSQPQLNLG